MAASSRTSSGKPRRLPVPGEEADSWLIAHYLMARCDLTAQQVGALIGCSPPTVYRVLSKKIPQDSVGSHLDAIWGLLSGKSSFGEELSQAPIEDRIKVVQRMSRQTPAELIWRTGLREAAKMQLAQIRGPAPAVA